MSKSTVRRIGFKFSNFDCQKFRRLGEEDNNCNWPRDQCQNLLPMQMTFTENLRNIWGNDLVEFSLRFRKYADFLLSWNHRYRRPMYFVFLPPCCMMNASHPTWRPTAKVNFSLKTVCFLYNFADMTSLSPFSTFSLRCGFKSLF